MSYTGRTQPVTVRALAIICAVALVGFLVGLSVAPTALPGEAFDITPKAAAGAAVSVDHVHDPQVDRGLEVAPHSSTVGVAARTGSAEPVIVTVWHRRAVDLRALLPTRTPHASSGRGPPLPV
jgi:hypothetical protein